MQSHEGGISATRALQDKQQESHQSSSKDPEWYNASLVFQGLIALTVCDDSSTIGLPYASCTALVGTNTSFSHLLDWSNCFSLSRVFATLFTNQSGFSIDENGLVTDNPPANATYLGAHAEVVRIAKVPLKSCDLGQVLFEGVFTTGSKVTSLDALVSESTKCEDNAISPSAMSPLSASPSATSPLKRSCAKSVSLIRMRTALDRMSDGLRELTY